ncbi:class C sortase [Serinibacter arcticus]|uniref:Class C sortase n=1 Tax=Serinibacter arcticus TaxID=1655435 RepID=A0A2U1ZZT5_9MICO|nr:class C sortase [Serinibacter arcticus]
MLPFVVALLFLGGTVTVLYPTGSAWVHQYQQAQVLAEYGDQVRQLDPTGREESLALAHRYNELLTGGAVVGSFRNVPVGDGAEQPEMDYRQQLNAGPTGSMGRVKIPAIDVDLPIYHGTSDEVLLEGVGHLEGTALPVGGPSTHSVLTAHRGLAEAELFTNLDRVVEGDTFTIEVFGEVLTYRVRSTQVVEPSDTETLYPVAGEDLVTLVTCTPLGINTQRILVTGERVIPTPIADLEAEGAPSDLPRFPWWAVILGGVVLAVGTYVWLMGRPITRGAHRRP